MNLRKHGLKALGLSLLAALGLMAFMASAAQAKEGLFLINNSLASLLATATGGLIGGTGTLLVPALDTEILCTGVTVQAGSEIETAHKGKATLIYTGCLYYITSELPAKVKPGVNCKILHEGGAAGQILATAKLTPILVKLAGGTEHKLLILASPLTGERFALIKSEKCNIPNEVEVKGSTVIQLLAADAAKQEFIEAPEALRLLTPNTNLDQLKYGVHDAFIDGEGFVSLTGAHANLTWGSE